MGAQESVPLVPQTDEMAQRCSTYANLMSDLDSTLASWVSRRLSMDETRQRVEGIVDKIQDLGYVDKELANEDLYRKGLDARRRLEMEKTYRELQGKAPGDADPRLDPMYNAQILNASSKKKTCC
mmetsp:Transcript_26131/g.68742  ORF Transcript_26131/g.68742 Transcript_26131/m.68742 type:complete len:125 (-) Transcript_26131:142-516(-)